MRAACLVLFLAFAAHADEGQGTPADDASTTVPAESATESVVRARKKKPLAAVAIPAEEARHVPGTEGDPVKIVADLPGVDRAPFGSGQLVVWGADPNDTRVEIDGVEVPALFHYGGIRSVVNADLIDDVLLIPGAYGVDHGRGIGGIVEVTTRDLPKNGVHAALAADVIDGSALVSASVPAVRVAAAGRVSWLDGLLEHVLPADVGDVFPIPRYFDAQSKATFQLRDDEQVSVGVLASGDALDRTVPAQDPGEVRTQTVATSFYRLYARYSYLTDDGARIVVVPSVGYDTDHEGTSLGPRATSLDVVTADAAVRASYRKRIVSGVALTLGLDALDAQAQVKRNGTIGIPAREGDDITFGQAPSDDVNDDQWGASTVDVAPYASAEAVLGPVTFTPGVRVDGFALGASRLTPRIGATPAIGHTSLTFVLDPRATLEWRAAHDVTLRASAGTYHQPPAAVDVSAVFGTPDLGLEKSTHFAVGGSSHLTSTLDLDATLYYRYSEDLIVRSPSASPELAHVLSQDGVGVDVGASVLLRQQLANGLFGWIAYTLSRSERQNHASDVYRLSDFDQTHVLSLVLSYELFGFTLSSRARAATGAPRTPVIGAYYDGKDDRYDPIFGPKNTDRLPAFFQLDARGETTFHWSSTSLNVFVELQNLTLQQNAEEIVYDFDYGKHGFISGLPFLGLVGARLLL